MSVFVYAHACVIFAFLRRIRAQLQKYFISFCIWPSHVCSGSIVFDVCHVDSLFYCMSNSVSIASMCWLPVVISPDSYVCSVMYMYAFVIILLARYMLKCKAAVSWVAHSIPVRRRTRACSLSSADALLYWAHCISLRTGEVCKCRCCVTV